MITAIWRESNKEIGGRKCLLAAAQAVSYRQISPLKLLTTLIIKDIIASRMQDY